MATAAKKEPPVQEVRNVGLEDRLDKVISLIEGQNKAWQRCLTLLTEMNTLLFEKYKASDLLLEEHPPVKAPPPATVSGAAQPQPFNNYSDSGCESRMPRVGHPDILKETKWIVDDIPTVPAQISSQIDTKSAYK